MAHIPATPHLCSDIGGCGWLEAEREKKKKKKRNKHFQKCTHAFRRKTQYIYTYIFIYIYTYKYINYSAKYGLSTDLIGIKLSIKYKILPYHHMFFNKQTKKN